MPKLTMDELAEIFGPRAPIEALDFLFSPENAHLTNAEMRAEMRKRGDGIALVKAGRTWCQPGDVKERNWIVMFEDADLGMAKFTDEKEARDYFAKADGGGWNCYLFQAAPIDPSDQDRYRRS